MPDFINPNDAEFLQWVNNYSALITANAVSYGLSAAIATTLATKVTAFADALAAATASSTRGGSTILAKDTARADLVAYVRETARQVQGTMTVTNQQRFDLGLSVRDTEPTPIPPPANAPQILILETSGNTVTIRLVDPENTSRRGRPDGVDGMAVFSFVGPTAPAEEATWKFEGNTTRTSFDVNFPATVAPGAKVWFTAFYFNERKQSGPAATAVGTNLPGGAAMAA